MNTLRSNKGLSLVEALVSVVLVGALLVSILGAFIISRLGVDRAKHRMMAMNTIREYMEQEIKAGYLGGYVSGSYYATVSSSSPVEFEIDEGLNGTITPDPYPGTIDTIGTYPKTARYKLVGFVVQWDEKLFGGASLPTSIERTAAYVAEHN